MIALIDSQLLTHPFTAPDVHKDGVPSPARDDSFERVGIAYLGDVFENFQGSTSINQIFPHHLKLNALIHQDLAKFFEVHF